MKRERSEAEKVCAFCHEELLPPDEQPEEAAADAEAPRSRWWLFGSAASATPADAARQRPRVWRASSAAPMPHRELQPLVEAPDPEAAAWKPFEEFAAEVVAVIDAAGGAMLASKLPEAYEAKYGKPLDFKALGFASMSALAPRMRPNSCGSDGGRA